MLEREFIRRGEEMKYFILRCIGIILEILFYATVVSIIVFFVSCSSVQPGSGDMKTASYQQTAKEIQEALEHGDNLTPAQKIILAHAAADLKDAQTQSQQAAKLQDKLITASEKAGAGKMIYALGGFIIFLIVIYIGNKALKILRL